MIGVLLRSNWFFLALTILGGVIGKSDMAKTSLVGDFLKVLSKPKDLFTKNIAMRALAAGGLKVGQAVFQKPGIQASIDSTVRQVWHGSAEATEAPAEVEWHAAQIAEILNAQQVRPLYLAVDGVPGSGKSSLARQLAKKLKMKHICLDHTNLDEPIRLEAREAIYDHHRLLRTQDIDCFDAIIYFDESVERSKSRILERKRGGILVDVLDFDLLKRVGKKAFSTANGQTYDIPNSGIKLKIRPEEGFGAYQNLVEELRPLGVELSGLAKEQLLFLATDGKAKNGFLAYANPNAYSREILSGLAEGALMYSLGKK